MWEYDITKRRKNKEGYYLVKVSNYPTKSKWIREHRIIMENHLGRKLLRTEHIHHKNKDRTDNRIENLEITSNREHIIEHIKKFGGMNHKGVTLVLLQCPECEFKFVRKKIDTHLKESGKHGTKTFCSRSCGVKHRYSNKKECQNILGIFKWKF